MNRKTALGKTFPLARICQHLDEPCLSPPTSLMDDLHVAFKRDHHSMGTNAQIEIGMNQGADGRRNTSISISIIIMGPYTLVYRKP